MSPTYRSGRLTAKITYPILFCVCETDSVTPAVPTLRYAAMALRGEVRMYPEGHFAIYVDLKPTPRSSVPSPTNLLFTTRT